MIMLNGKDSFWLQLEVCREYQRSRCNRTDIECKFAHPPTNVEVQSNGRVTACYDSIKNRCQRESCKYMHPPAHLKDQLLINGRNHLALKNALIQQHQQHHSHNHYQDPLSQQQQQQPQPQLHNSINSSSSSQTQQQQAALFQSAVAAAAAAQQQQQQQHHHLQNGPQTHHHHHPHSHQTSAALNAHQHQHQTHNRSSHLEPPQAASYDLSMTHPAAALAAAIAASTMNPFMAPGALLAHSPYAGQYAAAVAAAAAAAQQQHQHQQQRQSPRAPSTYAPPPSDTIAASKHKSNGPQSQSPAAAPPAPAPAQAAAAAAAAAMAAAAAAAAATASSVPSSNQEQLAYYVNPAAMAAAAAAAILGNPQQSGPASHSSFVPQAYQQQQQQHPSMASRFAALTRPLATGSPENSNSNSSSGSGSSSISQSPSDHQSPATYAALPPGPPPVAPCSPLVSRPQQAKNDQDTRRPPVQLATQVAESVRRSCDRETGPVVVVVSNGVGGEAETRSDCPSLRMGSNGTDLVDFDANQTNGHAMATKSKYDELEHDELSASHGKARKRLHLDPSFSSPEAADGTASAGSPLMGPSENLGEISSCEKSGQVEETSSRLKLPFNHAGDDDDDDDKSSLTDIKKAPSTTSVPPEQVAQEFSMDDKQQQQQHQAATPTNGDQHQQTTNASSGNSARRQPNWIRMDMSHENGFGSLELATLGASSALLLSNGQAASNQRRQTAAPSTKRAPTLKQPLPPLASLQNSGQRRPSFRLEICREFLRNSCKRPEQECRFAHPPAHIVAAQAPQLASLGSEANGGLFVTVCMDFMNGRCARNGPKCRFLHPVAHLQCQLIQARRSANWMFQLSGPNGSTYAPLGLKK